MRRLVAMLRVGVPAIGALYVSVLMLVGMSTTALAMPPRLLDSPAPVIAAAGANLLLNPGAETGMCTTSGYDAMTVPGWTVTPVAGQRLLRRDRLPAAGVHRARPPAGRAFFSGGATGDATMTQRVDVSLGGGPASTPARVRYDAGRLARRLGRAERPGRRSPRRSSTAPAGCSARGRARNRRPTPTATGSPDSCTAPTAGTLPAGPAPCSSRSPFTWTAGDTTDGYADDLALSPVDPGEPRRGCAAPASDVPALRPCVLRLHGERERAADRGAGRAAATTSSATRPRRT